MQGGCGVGAYLRWLRAGSQVRPSGPTVALAFQLFQLPPSVVLLIPSIAT